VKQWNDVDATATSTATARISQGIVQEQNGNGRTDQSLDAAQVTANSQLAVSATQVAQQSAHNIDKVMASAPKHASVGAVQQSNSAHGSATASVDADIAQWIGQFQDAGAADSQQADATQLHTNTQDGVAASQVAQSRTTNLNDVDVPNGSRATNPTVGQQNETFVDTSATNVSKVDGWIHQAQGGVGNYEMADAQQEGLLGQVNSASAPAQQNEVLNAASWRGIEPPAEPNPTDGGDNPGGPTDGGPTDGGPTDGGPTNGGPTDGGPSNPGTTDGGPSSPSTNGDTGTRPGGTQVTTPFNPSQNSADGSKSNGSPNGADRGEKVGTTQSDRHGEQYGTLTPPRGPSWALSHGNAPLNDGSNAPPANGPSAPPPSAPPAPTPPQTPAAGSSPNGPKTETLTPRGKNRGHGAPPPPLGHGDWSDLGATSPAPSAGGGGAGGLAVLTLGQYELAVPEVLGRQLSILVLGRSGSFVEPFEWPG
jgi:hypothetical protein